MAIEKIEKIGSEIPSEAPPDELAQEELKDKFSGDEKRQEEKKQVIHNAFIRFVQIAAYVMIAVFIVRMLHFILPEKWCWLTPDQLTSLDKFLFSGALGGLVVGSIKQAFGSKEE